MNLSSTPELGFPNAYALALTAVAKVGTGMSLFFRKTGWFD